LQTVDYESLIAPGGNDDALAIPVLVSKDDIDRLKGTAAVSALSVSNLF